METTTIRIIVLVVGLVSMVLLFQLSIYVTEAYWYAAITDGEDRDPPE
jgi:hypothetical protein